ncbi:serine hydrolase domain-containing protein [Nonomuraea endophytica]|uniref:serine hydrolase domain-containing protein n=1 Tax=Nonomuraea endophytica TaxID=714136 RepID=UPI0037CBD428
MRRLGTLPLMHQPGEVWQYNISHDVLGVLVARVTGKPFETFLRERVFDPLGMKDTGFHVPAAKIHRLPPLYAHDPETGKLIVGDEPVADQHVLPRLDAGHPRLLDHALPGDRRLTHRPRRRPGCRRIHSAHPCCARPTRTATGSSNS